MTAENGGQPVTDPFLNLLILIPGLFAWSAMCLFIHSSRQIDREIELLDEAITRLERAAETGDAPEKPC